MTNDQAETKKIRRNVKFAIVADKRGFGEVLSRALRVINKKSVLPVLSMVKITSIKSKNILMITATDLELTVATRVIGAEVLDDIELCIPAQVLTDTVKTLFGDSNPLILIGSENGKLNLECGTFKCKISGLIAEEFPALRKFSLADGFEIETALIKQVAQYNGISVEDNNARPVLTGIYIHGEKGKIAFDSADGFRLSRFAVASQLEINVLVPERVITELATLDESKLKLLVLPSPDNLVAFTENTIYISLQIEGKFPDVDQLLPDPTKMKFVIDIEKDSLATAVKRAMIFGGENKIIQLSIVKDTLSVYAQDNENGDTNTAIPVVVKKIPGEEFKFAVCGTFLMQYLAVIGKPMITIYGNSRTSPFLFVPTDGSVDFKYLLMPVDLAGQTEGNA
jgi:DNA polymerase-3 subunit beta